MFPVLFLCFWLPGTYSGLLFSLSIWHLSQPISQHLQVIVSHSTQAAADTSHLPVAAGTAGLLGGFLPRKHSLFLIFFSCKRKRQCVQPQGMNHSWSKLFVEIPIHFAWDWFWGGHVTQFWPMTSKEKFYQEFPAKIFLPHKRKIPSFWKTVMWRCDTWSCGSCTVTMKQDLILTLRITEDRKIQGPSWYHWAAARFPYYELILQAANALMFQDNAGILKTINSNQTYF